MTGEPAAPVCPVCSTPEETVTHPVPSMVAFCIATKTSTDDEEDPP